MKVNWKIEYVRDNRNVTIDMTCNLTYAKRKYKEVLEIDPDAKLYHLEWVEYSSTPEALELLQD
jgi:hypothetical protein